MIYHKDDDDGRKILKILFVLVVWYSFCRYGIIILSLSLSCTVLVVLFPGFVVANTPGDDPVGSCL